MAVVGGMTAFVVASLLAAMFLSSDTERVDSVIASYGGVGPLISIMAAVLLLVAASAIAAMRMHRGKQTSRAPSLPCGGLSLIHI